MRPKNTFDEDPDRLDRTAVNTFNDILDYIGVQPGKKCDPADCRVKQILMLTDGDVDGIAISNTVVSLLAKHCKPLIEAGMVGRILPPFYSFKNGKKTVYVRSQREFFKMIMDDFVKKVSIGHKRLGDLSKKQLFELVDKNFEYTTKLDKLWKHHYCTPKFLEYVASKYHGELKDQTPSYWTKAMRPFDDLVVKKEGSIIIIDGNIGEDYINLAIDKSFDHDVKKFKECQEVNEYIDGYIINGKEDRTLYDIMHAFDKHKPVGVKRFKGLGELDAKTEMWPLCLNPETRKVVIYKFSDNIEDDMHKIEVIMSSKQEFIRARSELLRNMTAEDLDIDT